MFPYDLDEGEAVLFDGLEADIKEYEIDFDTGQLTGRVVSGLDAIKVWAWLALHTERYKYQQYSWDYGTEVDTLIGNESDPDFISSEVERMVRDCLTTNDKILDIDDFECSVNDQKITANFTIITEYGDGEMSV